MNIHKKKKECGKSLYNCCEFVHSQAKQKLPSV